MNTLASFTTRHSAIDDLQRACLRLAAALRGYSESLGSPIRNTDEALIELDHARKHYAQAAITARELSDDDGF